MSSMPLTSDVPGRAGELLASLGTRAALHDVYAGPCAPVYHELTHRDTHEVRELVALVRRTAGPILELAAGSGRLTMPLLALGREVTALELSADMSALLEERLAASPARLSERCAAVRGDMTDFSLGRRFGAVVLGTTSISLLDRQGREGLYACVREHLAPGGRFLLSTVQARSDVDSPAETETEVVTSTGEAYRMFEHWPPDGDARVITFVPVESGDGAIDVCTSTIRVLPAADLAAELRAAGLVATEHLLPPGGWRHASVLIEAEAAT